MGAVGPATGSANGNTTPERLIHMKHPYLVLVLVGLALAAWVVCGRALFGILGEFTQLYVLLLGVPIIVLHVLIARAVTRTTLAGFPIRLRTKWTLLAAWACLLLLGFTIPDRVNGTVHSILTGDIPGVVGMAIGISNPLGIVGVGLLVASLMCAIFDKKSSEYCEDEVIDRFERDA